MSSNTSASVLDGTATCTTASFSNKYFDSHRFEEVFQGGMVLVEEAANYLEGAGRLEAKQLDSSLAYAYATESMRLTTRLMQIASWLLIRRAVSDGKMTAEQAMNEESQLKLKSATDLECTAEFEQLPATFRNLVLRSLKLFERVLCMDRILASSRQLQHGNTPNGVLDHHDELAFAFAHKDPSTRAPQKG